MPKTRRRQHLGRRFPSADPRAVRNLREDITFATEQLAKWRRDGHYERIMHWLGRSNDLLDRLAEITAQPEGTAQ